MVAGGPSKSETGRCAGDASTYTATPCERLDPKAVSYSFEHTSVVGVCLATIGELRFNSIAEPSGLSLSRYWTSLDSKAINTRQHSLLALERFFAIRDANRFGMVVTDRCRNDAEQAFRRERDLIDDVQLERWMNENGLSQSEFDALMIDEARLRWSHDRTRICIAQLPVRTTSGLR